MKSEELETKKLGIQCTLKLLKKSLWKKLGTQWRNWDRNSIEYSNLEGTENKIMEAI